MNAPSILTLNLKLTMTNNSNKLPIRTFLALCAAVAASSSLSAEEPAGSTPPDFIVGGQKDKSHESSLTKSQNDAPVKKPKDIVLDFRDAKNAAGQPERGNQFPTLAEQKALLEARINAHEKFMQHMRNTHEKMPLVDPASKMEQDKVKREMLEKIETMAEQNPNITVTREGHEAALLRMEKIGEQMKSALREVEKMIEQEGK